MAKLINCFQTENFIKYSPSHARMVVGGFGVE